MSVELKREVCVELKREVCIELCKEGGVCKEVERCFQRNRLDSRRV